MTSTQDRRATGRPVRRSILIDRPVNEVAQQFCDRSDRFHRSSTVTGANLEGGTLVFDIVESGPGSAEVTAALTPPNTLLIRLAGPILRRAIGRSLG